MRKLLAVLSATLLWLSCFGGFGYHIVSHPMAYSPSCTSQTISMSFDSTTPFTVGDSDRAITESATSGLTVTNTTNDSGICTIVSGAVHAVGAGTCIVYGDQAGNGTYCAASQVSQSIDVSAAGGSCGTTKAYVASSYRSGAASAASAAISTSSPYSFTAGQSAYAIIAGYISGNPPTVSSVSDGTNPWTYVGRETDSGGSVIELWYHYYTSDLSSATITGNFSASTSYRAIGMAVFTGGYNGDEADGYAVHAKGGSTSTTFTTDTNVTITCPDEVLIAGFSYWDQFNHTAGTNWTLLSPTSTTDFDFGYQIVTSTGDYPGGTIVTASGSTYAIGIMGAFK